MELIILILAFAKDRSADDISIYLAIKNGDSEAFREFFNANYDSLYKFLISRGMSYDEAEELIQKAFVLIWEKRENIDETKSLRAYLFQIAYSRMLNHIKYQSRFTETDHPVENKHHSDTETDINHSELLSHVRAIISDMPDKRGMVFELCFLKQFTYKEAADTMGVSTKTIENHMGQAFKDLRSSLKQIYGKEILSDYKK